MSNNARNYHAHGGNEWVIGGKLTFLPGAVVEGAEGLFDLPSVGEAINIQVHESDATTIAALREDFNALIAALRNAGFVVPTSGDAD